MIVKLLRFFALPRFTVDHRRFYRCPCNILPVIDALTGTIKSVPVFHVRDASNTCNYLGKIREGGRGDRKKKGFCLNYPRRPLRWFITAVKDMLCLRECDILPRGDNRHSFPSASDDRVIDGGASRFFNSQLFSPPDIVI